MIFYRLSPIYKFATPVVQVNHRRQTNLSYKSLTSGPGLEGEHFLTLLQIRRVTGLHHHRHCCHTTLMSLEALTRSFQNSNLATHFKAESQVVSMFHRPLAPRQSSPS